MFSYFTITVVSRLTGKSSSPEETMSGVPFPSLITMTLKVTGIKCILVCSAG